jgi:chromosome segregation ATPase
VCGTTYSKGKEACSSQHLPKERVEKFVIEKIKGHILTDEHLAELVKLVNEELDTSIKKYKERIEVIDHEIDQWQGRLEHLYDFVETKAIDPVRMAKRIADVQDKIDEMRRVRLEIEEALQTRRLEPVDPEAVLGYIKDLKEFLEDSSIFERRAFLRSFIESIEVDDGQITLNYTLPLPPDNSRQEAASVLGIVPSSPLLVHKSPASISVSD